jgi:hypothetical protein
LQRIYHYKIDAEGRLWIEGTELTDPQVLKLFMGRMEKLEGDKFRVLCMGELNLIEAEDVPYVVQGIEIQGDKIELFFPGGYREMLDPNTLRVGKANVLYCTVRGGEFPARFNRKSYLELTRLVERDSKKRYFLKLGRRRYSIAGI